MNAGLLLSIAAVAVAAATFLTGIRHGWIAIPPSKPPPPEPVPPRAPVPAADGQPPPAPREPPEPDRRQESRADQGAPATVAVNLLPDKVRGRDDLLGKLQRQLREGGLAVLVGAGGIGKSTIARELARRMPPARGAETPAPRWEVSAATKGDLTTGLITVARDLGASEADLDVIATLKPSGPDRLWKLLEQGPPGWLLIIDNADQPEYLAAPKASGGTPPRVGDGRGWARTSGRGLMLISSRDSGADRPGGIWPAQAILYPVQTLSDADAAKILLDLAPRAGSEFQARGLANRLGGLPLVLRLAGHYLSSTFAERHASFDAYRRALENDPRVIRLLDGRGRDPERFKRVMVMFTWELSLNALAKRGLPQARPLLRLLSCYASARPLPVSLLRAEILDPFLRAAAGPAREPGAGDVPVNELLDGLHSLGLIEDGQLGTKKALLVHPVIADTNQSHLMKPGPGDPSPVLVRQTAVGLLASALDDLTEDRLADWPAYRMLTPHLQAIVAGSTPKAGEGPESRLDKNHVATLVRVTGNTALAYGQMRLAEFGLELVSSALDHPLSDDGTPNPIMLLARQQKAYLLDQCGRHADAEPIYRAVLKVQLSMWPEDDPANLAARYNLAASVGAQGRWQEAKAAFDKILEDERRVLGDNHPHTLDTRLGLNVLLCRQEAWAQAEHALRDLLDDERRIFGNNSSGSLATRFDLAQALRHLGRSDEATTAVRALLQDATTLLGKEHPITVTIREFDGKTLLIPRVFSTPALREKVAEELLNTAAALGKQASSREAAVTACQRLADRFGGDPSPALRQVAAKALLTAAAVLNALGRSQDAAAAFQKVVDRFGGDPEPAMRDLVTVARRNAERPP